MARLSISWRTGASAVLLVLFTAAPLAAQAGGAPSDATRTLDLPSFVRLAVEAAWDRAAADRDRRLADDAYLLAQKDGRAAFDVEALRIDAAAKALKVREADATAVTDAVSAYFNVLQAERSREAGLRAVAVREGYAESVARKVKEGVAQEEDALDQALLLANARASLLSAEASLAKARRQLQRLAGLDPTAGIAVQQPVSAALDAAAARAAGFGYASLLERATAASSACAGSKMKDEYARRRLVVLSEPPGSVAPKERDRLAWESRSAAHALQVQTAALEDSVTDLLARRDSLAQSIALAAQKKDAAEKKLASQKVKLSYEFVLPVDVQQAEASLFSEETGLQKAREDAWLHALRILAAAGEDPITLLAGR